MVLDSPPLGKRKPPKSAISRAFRHLVPRPTRCLACGARSREPLCAACFRDLPWNDHACRLCAASLPDLPAMLCGACARRPPVFDAARAAFAYAWPVDRLIQRFKFKGDLATGRVLALALLDYLRLQTLPAPELIVPVPLHRSRLAERGFNQAAEICRVLARPLGIRIDHGLLARTRATPAQAGLGAAARRRNLAGAFACRRPVANQRIAVVDDVITTGGTAEAIARTLKQAGAAEVYVYALARA